MKSIEEKTYSIHPKHVGDIIEDLIKNYYAVNTKKTEDGEYIKEIRGSKVIEGKKVLPAYIGTISSKKGEAILKTNSHENIDVEKSIDAILKEYRSCSISLKVEYHQ